MISVGQYVAAVLDWQRGYGCTRLAAEKDVCACLGVDRPNVPANAWAAPAARRRGRPAAEKLTRAQNVGILMAFFRRAHGARTIDALKLVNEVLPATESISRSKALQALAWAEVALPAMSAPLIPREVGCTAQTWDTYALAAWMALGARGDNPTGPRTKARLKRR